MGRRISQPGLGCLMPRANAEVNNNTIPETRHIVSLVPLLFSLIFSLIMPKLSAQRRPFPSTITSLPNFDLIPAKGSHPANTIQYLEPTIVRPWSLLKLSCGSASRFPLHRLQFVPG